jgi:flagellar biosynthesis/type III secretory pathway protein FliH
MNINKFNFEYLIEPTKGSINHPEIINSLIEIPQNDIENEITESHATQVIPPPLKAFNDEEIEEAKKASFDEGYKQAQQENEQEAIKLNTSINEVLEQINIQLALAINEQNNYFIKLNKLAADISFKISKKILGDIFTIEHENLVYKNIEKCLKTVIGESEVLIVINPQQEAHIKAKLEELKIKSNFEGKINLKTDESIFNTDCKVMWNNGLIETDNNLLWQKIEAIL